MSVPAITPNSDQVNVLRMGQVNRLALALALEQVAIVCSLLHRNSVDSVSLLEDLLRRSPFGDQAGYRRLGPRLLGGFVDSIETVGDEESGDGDVEAALYRCNQQMLATWYGAGVDSRQWVFNEGVQQGHTPKPSFTGSAWWAAWESKRRGCRFRSRFQAGAADRLARNMAWTRVIGRGESDAVLPGVVD